MWSCSLYELHIYQMFNEIRRREDSSQFLLIRANNALVRFNCVVKWARRRWRSTWPTRASHAGLWPGRQRAPRSRCSNWTTRARRSLSTASGSRSSTSRFSPIEYCSVLYYSMRLWMPIGYKNNSQFTIWGSLLYNYICTVYHHFVSYTYST